MKGFILVGLIVLFPLYTQCQGRANTWLMGYGPTGHGIKMDFNQNPVQIDSAYCIMPFFMTNATISDENGNLLFASNGVFVMNANNDTMMNGDSLNPGWFATINFDGLFVPQGNFVIPYPGDTNKYILFHETCEYQTWYRPLHLFYSIIDMQLDNGLGEVIQKNIATISDTLYIGEITGVKHANGRDWWIIVHRDFSNLFYKVLVTPTQILTSSQTIGIVRNDWSGQSVLSPDGNLFAHYNPGTDLDIYNFDRCTGMLTNHVNIPINDSAACWGIAFSSNSHYLYVSSMYYVYQFDVSQTNVAATQTTVAVWDSFYSPNPPFATTFFLAQLAPDGKIYINNSNSSNYLHVINNPDSQGLSCNLVQHGTYLDGERNHSTMANHPNYYLGPVPGSICDSLTGMQEPLSEIRNYAIRPNPNNGEFEINYLLPQTGGKGQAGWFEVYNITGQCLHRKPLPPWSTRQSIHISGLPAGVYFAVIKSFNKTINRKFVVMEGE